ncbi:hypothetical protein KSP39_PZI024045 [Platanthera zijinensis]|uniref:Uncharacterized protein n=1 Tax=Platanthera zijinensis TaxID=2320716 RepID=A0AAP0ATG6_9ASPA
MNSKGIPLWLIHPHWKELVLNETFGVDVESNIDIEVKKVVQKFYDSNEQQKKEIKRKLREIIESTLSQTMEPSVPLKLKGRPKRSRKKFNEDVLSTKRLPSKFEYALLEDRVLKTKKKRYKLPIRKNQTFVDRVRHLFTPFWSEQIVDAVDVLGDGHCGYRVISDGLKVIGDWPQVRNDLYWELENKKILYDVI